MRKALFISILCFTYIYSFAKENAKPVKETIQKVTVFQSSAQIESYARTFVNEGVTEIVFESLPATINRQSIQVSGEGDFTILSVQTETNYLNVQGKSKEVLLLEDSLAKYNYLLEIENIKKYALDQEESLLLSNKELSTKENVAVDIEDVSELYRTRLPKIKEEQYLTNLKVKKLSEVVNRYKAEIQSKMNQQNSSDVIVTVSTNNSANIKINLTYIAYNVGWTPLYDIRSNNIKSDINIVYKANVYQNTGVDWKNVKIVLSTGNPSVNGIKPILNPWYMAFVSPIVPTYYYDKSAAAEEIRKLPSRNINSLSTSDGTYQAASAPAVGVSETQLSRSFEIAQPYSILSNGKPKAVEIQNYSVKGQYEYITIPKLDQRAYLVANITDWEKLNLLSGKANVFFEDAFVGETYLNTQTTEDTLQVSLGSDKSIVVKREKVAEMSSIKTIGSNKKVSVTYDISIRNTKNSDISITAEDQLPVSQDNSIEVKIINIDKAIYDEATGKLKWPMKIAPGETKKVRFSFEIKYPKNKLVNGLD